MSSSRIARLLRASRRFPALRRGLLERALRLSQQALASNVEDRDALLWLGLIWWQLGARRRGREMLKALNHSQGCGLHRPVGLF
ncbi:hypothetical protein [Alcanivorax jadensis]|uniref:hypothetical protein n=1 Tax=Alcanivorax jadensis TaxID=64988 RepID=UPI0012EC304D|nr:hypothetical protein [Alcanivorax jadensis]